MIFNPINLVLIQTLQSFTTLQLGLSANCYLEWHMLENI